METEASVAPFMVDFERLFSPKPEDHKEAFYVAYKGERYYGQDPSSLAQGLRERIAKTTRINTAYSNSRNPNAKNLLVAPTGAMSNIRSGLGSLGRGLFKGTQKIGKATASGLGAVGRSTAKAARSARNYAFKAEIDPKTGEPGKSRVGRLGSSIATGAKAVGSAAATGAKVVGSAAATGAKVVGSAAATGAKAVGSAFGRTNTRKVRPGSVANSIRPSNLNSNSIPLLPTSRAPRPGSAAAMPINVSSA